MIGFVSIVVGLLLGAGTLQFLKLLINPVISIPYFLGIGLLVGSIILALCSFRIRDWIIVPNVETLITEYTDLPYEEVLQKNAGEMSEAVTDTMDKNDRKATFIEWSWYFLIGGLISIFCYLLIFIFWIDKSQLNIL